MSAPVNTEALLEERGKQYGDANVQYARVAEVWSGITGHTITAHQAMLCMVGLKLVRAEMNPDHDDSLADAKGYVVLAERLVASWTEQPDPQPEVQGCSTWLPGVHVNGQRLCSNCGWGRWAHSAHAQRRCTHGCTQCAGVA